MMWAKTPLVDYRTVNGYPTRVTIGAHYFRGNWGITELRSGETILRFNGEQVHVKLSSADSAKQYVAAMEALEK